MLAHRIQVTIPENHEVLLRVPDDFPPGEAVVLITSFRGEASAKVSAAANGRHASPALGDRFPRAGTFGPAVFQEDPTAPLDDMDWSEERL